MEDRARPEDYRILGISPQAGAEELERAYHRVRVLYGESSLASYSMMDQVERAAMRDRIEEAYLRASRTLARRQEAGFTPPPPEASPEAPPPAAPGTPPGGPLEAPPGPFAVDWTAPPGPQMKRNREERGITLPQIATVTRIRATHFANIEDGKLADLPAPVYLRGFLVEYARRTSLPDPEVFATRYLAWVAQQPQYKG